MATKLKKMRRETAKKAFSDADAEKAGAGAEKSAEKKGLKGEQKDAYVYGTKRKMGWESKRERG